MKVDRDGKKRCFGRILLNDRKNELAIYHDEEWCIPVHDDRTLFELLILEGAQSGLSWETIFKKRDAYRKTFHNFDPNKVVKMTDDTLKTLLKSSSIVRHKLKVYSVRSNAEAFIKIQKEFGSFDKYIWSFVDNKPVINEWESIEDVPAYTEDSDYISRDLKRRGMLYVGKKIIYAYMQAIGMVNDHVKDCWCYERDRNQ